MEGFDPECAWRWRGVTVAAVCGLGLMAGLAACAAGNGQATTGTSVAANPKPGNPEASEMVECRLPLEIERRGRQVTTLGASQVVQLSRDQCRARKGEVIPATQEPGPAPAR